MFCGGRPSGRPPPRFPSPTIVRRVSLLVRSIACAGALLGGARLGAQEAATLESWRLVRYATREGIRSPIVQSLAESSTGTVWVATASGIAWFDGWRWHQSRSEPDLLTRPASRLRPMAADSMLAVIHNLLFVGDTAGFTRLAVVVDGTEEQVHDATWSDEGLILLVGFGASMDSVRLMRWRGGRAEPLAAPAPLVGRGVASLHPAAGSGYWLNTSGGLYRRRAGRWERRIEAAGRALRVPVLAEGPTGWTIASVSVERSPDAIWAWRGESRPVPQASEGVYPILGAIVDGDELLAVHSGGYLRRFDGRRWQTVNAEYGALADVRAVLRDRLGDLWIGTGQGLVLVREASRLWTGTAHPFPSLRNRVNAVLSLPNGELWVASGDGIEVIGPGDRRRHIARIADAPLRTVTALARDSAGNVWVGSGSDLDGALRWDGRTWRRFTARDGLGARHVHRIVVAPDGAVWFLGIDAGEFTFNTGPGAFEYRDARFRRVGVEDGLPSGRVYDFAQSRDGTQWFGTSAGLSRLRDGKWTHWTERRGRTRTRDFSGTPIRVFTLDLDSTGTPWFSDPSSGFPYGIGTVEADTLRFVTTEQGLPSNQVQMLRFGRDGTLWAATNNGLAAYNAGAWYPFGTERGLGFPQLWPVEVTDSVVTVGTLGGGVRRLNLSEARVPPPRVEVAPPTIGTTLVSLQWQPHAWRGTIPAATIETRWRFDGGPWTPWGLDHATIQAFRRGRHTIEVQAKGAFAPLDAPITSVAFDVPGPIYARPAFLLPVGALALTIVALLVLGNRRQRRDAGVLRESEVRFRSLAGATSEGIAISMDGRVVDANEQLHWLLRAPPGALVGREVTALVALEGAGEATRIITRDDGSTFPAEVRETALAHQGRAARVTAVHDISDRETAMRALRESEERFETMFRSSPSAITLTLWPNGELVDVSRGFERLTGYARADVLDRSALALGIYEDPAERAALIATLAAQGRAENISLSLRRRDGIHRDVLGTFERLDLGGRQHVLGVLTDITERRTLEAQLLQSQKMEAVGRLAGGIAHDFNNLLTVILGNADMLRHSVERPESQADVEEIHSAARRASDLTRQLLTFARKQRIAPELLDLGEIVPRTQRMLARLLGERIRVDSRIAADVPLVVMDAGQLEQVLVNLAVNARDAMPQGGELMIEAGEVLLDDSYTRDHAEVAPGRYALVAITDTGIGIAPEALPRIFEPFFTTKEVGQGTGLGLSICYGIVREAGGHIAVYSEVGRGTTVKVYLPARTAARRNSPVPEPRALVGGSEPLLVVEDEALVRNLVERVLRSIGYQVVSAGDHVEAMAALERMPEPPRLLISDVVLPGPSGPEIARAVRARVPGIPVLYISGYTERGAAPMALDAPLLSKPFTPEQLATTVRAALDGSNGAAGGWAGGGKTDGGPHT